jgi:hypothetical protein
MLFIHLSGNFTEIFCQVLEICILHEIRFRLYRPIPSYLIRPPIGYHAVAYLQATVITCGSV